MSPLVLGEILGVFLNTLTADGKYRVQDCGNMQLPIQMQLTEKEKTFSEIFIPFLYLTQILNILKEMMMVIANVFSKLQTVKTFVKKLSQEDRFRTGFGSQHVKASQRLAKFPWQAFCHVFFIIFNEVDLVNISPSVR